MSASFAEPIQIFIENCEDIQTQLNEGGLTLTSVNILQVLKDAGFFVTPHLYIYKKLVVVTTSVSADDQSGDEEFENEKIGRVGDPPENFQLLNEYHIAIRVPGRWISVSPLDIKFLPESGLQMLLQSFLFSSVIPQEFSFEQNTFPDYILDHLVPYFTRHDLISIVTTCKQFHKKFHYSKIPSIWLEQRQNCYGISPLLNLERLCIVPDEICERIERLRLDTKLVMFDDDDDENNLVETIALHVAAYMRCPKVKSIFVSGALSEEWFRAVGELRELRQIQFNYCKWDPDWFLYLIGCPNLFEVNLCRYEADDTVLTHLGNCCSSLQSVVMERTWGVTSEGLSYLARGCPKLKNIETSRIGSPLEAAMYAFAEHCPEIQRIALPECDGFGDECLLALIDAKNLKSLEVNYGSYSSAGIDEFKTARSDVGLEYEFSDW